MSNKNFGFSIIELMVAVSITVILVFVSADYVRSGFVYSRYAVEQDTASQEARRAMEIMTREIRGANMSEQGDYPLAVIEDENLVFYSDVDDDNQMEKIRYHVEGNILYKNYNEPGPMFDYNTPISTSTISQYINNEGTAMFKYYDDSNSTTTLINNIRMINICIMVNVTPEILPNDYILESNVNLRNLKDN